MILHSNTRLEDIKESHLEMVLNWRNQECIRKYMFHNERIAMEEHLRWFHQMTLNPFKWVKIFYLNDCPSGFVQINRLSDHDCEWGLYIGNQQAPRGAGTIMGYLTIRYIFEHLLLNKIYAEVVSFNKRSIAYHEKLGFCKNGLQIREVPERDKEADVIQMCLTKESWRRNRRTVEQYIGGLNNE
ncbi:UDP-4-amino-4,6-dideoxy-N-acetyl-beta-L-altrosamine N-acetyltransferase [Sporolactobacillus putidus]|uniref:UDP-4-amino-4, 6-dideoxy-N-acetyl-beta-L-altrosamine N-acetyltransferase n=1 Tax=Sporolactobacillus putidus TaxID=492735 RepID=A0A917S3A4_9BACL|nr:UDP-4-amino-4,6-dideoxy-N-acetyl-beta-L-altrosamine N-acetyltransferase [Sporolactobacillus putidus]GGL54451.1 UDP-4-amino-4,6-dideoxy-N-acetyl-beta-L-altrosamine N-acetyltransferase [Sporolactobacillus putidus]